jgi:predicted MFS family arabinose efflux permease
VFAGASLACGVSPTLGSLIAARCVQALGGAVAVTAALELMPAVTGSERSAATTWAAAGAAGAALGPGVGGLLTELASWQSIFYLQVPLALLAGVPLLGFARDESEPGTVERELRETGRPHLAANLALALVAAAIAAALFLVVLLLIEGWRLSPIAAAAVVTVMPIAALFGGRLAPLVPSARARAASGAILVSGGLAGLGLLPKALIVLTVLPQVLVGVGLSLVLSALTETALAGRSPQALHGGWTIGARHAGVVVGLLALTPVFTADLREQRHDAIDAGTAVVLDAPVEPLLKIDLAQRISDRLEEERGKVPVLDPAFKPLPEDPDQRDAVEQLQDDLQDQLDRAATHAFSASFLIAALLALIALVPIAIGRRVEL